MPIGNQIMTNSTRIRAREWMATLALLLLTGCSVQNIQQLPEPASTTAGSPVNGHIMGGRQAIAGAEIELYAATNASYAGASTRLLGSPVHSDGAGNFSITGDFSCPTAQTLVYLVATGGNSGAGTNPNIALMTALGACGTLSASRFISLNEITTVAGVFALAPFMSSYQNVGVSPDNMRGLVNAFAATGKLAQVDTGSAPGVLPAGASAPVAKINTLADILATCINSTGGTSGDRSPCGSLFQSTTPVGEAAPTDTIAAILNIAKNPGVNVPSLFALITPSAPFQPTISAAKDFSIAINYKPALNGPTAAAVDSAGNLWIANNGNNSLVAIDTMGVSLTGSPYLTGNLSGPSAVTIGANGNVWVTNKTASTLSVFTPEGLGLEAMPLGLNRPSAITIDSQGVLWVANEGSDSLSSVVVQGTAIVSSETHPLSGIHGPVTLALGHP